MKLVSKHATERGMYYDTLHMSLYGPVICSTADVRQGQGSKVMWMVGDRGCIAESDLWTRTLIVHSLIHMDTLQNKAQVQNMTGTTGGEYPSGHAEANHLDRGIERLATGPDLRLVTK